MICYKVSSQLKGVSVKEMTVDVFIMHSLSRFIKPLLLCIKGIPLLDSASDAGEQLSVIEFHFFNCRHRRRHYHQSTSSGRMSPPAGVLFPLAIILVTTLLVPSSDLADASPQDTSPQQRDVGGPFMGIAKGISNGDFVRSILEITGIRQPPGSRGNQGPQPDIPWPNIATEALNQLDQNISRLLLQLQSLVRNIEASRVVG